MMAIVNDRGRVLVADDEPAVRRFTSAVLRAAGFEVDVVNTAFDALQALAQARYDAFIADIKMPGNEQLELIERLRGGPAVPLVLMTAEPSIDTALAAFRGGVIDYLVKPFTPEQLLDRIEAALERGRKSRAAAQTQASIAALLEAAAQVADSAGTGRPATAPRPPEPTPSSRGQPEPTDAEAVIAVLSPRQREIVRLLAQGHPLPDVAAALDLSAHTVRGHMKAIFAKLGVRSQVALLSLVTGRGPKSDAR